MRNLRFGFPEDASPLLRTHSGFAEPRFCIPSRRCEPYGAHSFWVCETSVSHSQNEMRTLWCTFILGCRRLGFAFPERDANPMVHIHSGLRNLGFCIPRTPCEHYGAQSFWACETQGVPRTRCEPYGRTRSGFEKPRFRIPRRRCKPCGAHSFWAGGT